MSLDFVIFGWFRNLGGKVKNIKQTYTALAYIFVVFGAPIILSFHFYFRWVEEPVEAWGLITLAVMFLIIAVMMMSVAFFFGNRLVEEGSIEEKKLDERNLEKRIKLKMFYVTPKQRKVISFIRFLLSLESIAVIVASILILTLL